ncbi:hypothetical protein L2747_17070 [Shewanella marinintestina]|uniref:hypothetical protein n=1 Tax=Shewanella marinintestina TaxID=190305 RepID=UPI00200BD424|nr:hypothetical protein [Shewanella marinintestina]MCL1147719.1 hypothetical protein [Shewanella marinintestina]
MLNGISDSLHVQQRNPRVAPTTVASPLLPERNNNQAATIPSHRLESYNKWAKVTQGQHKISAQQVAEQGLQQAKNLLKQLNNQGQQALKASVDSEFIGRAQQLQQRLSQLDIRYLDAPLIDHQLNLISANRPAAMHSFSLKSVDLTSPKPRDEIVQIQLGKDSTQVLLPANAQAHELTAKLKQGFAALDIEVQQSTDNRTIFKSHPQQWQQIKVGILMTGQGQRLPAGDIRTIKVQPELSWQDPQQWRFNSHEEIKQSLAKVAKSAHKVDTQLKELQTSQLHIQQQLHKANKLKDVGLNIDSTLNDLANLMQPSPFKLKINSLMAQANLTRPHVSSLLA